jgi:sialate O-acetylesterase
MNTESMALRLPKLLSDGCVLQHGAGAHVWGWGEPKSAVMVTLAVTPTQVISAAGTVSEDGTWDVMLGPLAPGGPYDLVVTMETKNLGGTEQTQHPADQTLRRRCYVGEVLLCAGQSNMELTMDWLHAHYADEFKRPADPLLRQYKIDEVHDFERPLADHASASWAGCGPTTVGNFSALAYFVGRRLRAALDVPVGLINASVGGSPIAAWLSKETMSAKMLSDFPDILTDLDPYRDAAGRPSNGIAARKSAESIAAIDEWYATLNWRAHDCEMIDPEGTSANPWFPLDLPCWFRDVPELNGFMGLLYLRTSVGLTAAEACAPAELHLGTLVDADTTYVNGVRVGHSDYQYLPRDYDIPAGVLREGENEILISMVCERGTGRVTPGKPLRLTMGNRVHDLASPAARWEGHVAARAVAACPVEDFVRWRPTVLYNAMLAPCEPMTVSSVVWYQGESDTGANAADRYAGALTALISQWRREWAARAGVRRLPFFVVQLPEFDIDVAEGDMGWSVVRAAQAAVAAALDDVAVVVGMGCGEWNDLHPADKRGLGERVARAVINVDEGVVGHRAE